MADGRSQYALESVHVCESLIRIVASTANSTAATWLHVSPRPALQLQWAARTVPFVWIMTQGTSGLADRLWECRTWQNLQDISHKYQFKTTDYIAISKLSQNNTKLVICQIWYANNFSCVSQFFLLVNCLTISSFYHAMMRWVPLNSIKLLCC